MTDDEVDDYVRHLHAHLPPAWGHVSQEQVRAILDAEAEYFELRFGSLYTWRALLRAVFGRGEPSPRALEAARPQFEAYVLEKLSGHDGLSDDAIRTVMEVEDSAGPLWSASPRQIDAAPTADEC